MNLPKHIAKYERTPLFNRLWAIWPKGKHGSSQLALKAWYKLNPNEADADMIFSVVERKKKEPGWREGFGIQHISTFLNQCLWMDEPIAEVAERANTGWQRTDAGICAKGAEIGLEAEAGWSMQKYLSEILKFIKAQ